MYPRLGNRVCLAEQKPQFGPRRCLNLQLSLLSSPLLLHYQEPPTGYSKPTQLCTALTARQAMHGLHSSATASSLCRFRGVFETKITHRSDVKIERNCRRTVISTYDSLIGVNDKKPSSKGLCMEFSWNVMPCIGLSGRDAVTSPPPVNPLAYC